MCRQIDDRQIYRQIDRQIDRYGQIDKDEKRDRTINIQGLD